MAQRWAIGLGDRLTSSKLVPRKIVKRELGLMIDAMAGLTGPMRREIRPIWKRIAEHYGRLGAARGLAAGEIVEEMQYLREVLIRFLAPVLAPMRPRQGMALLLRLNQLVDSGVAMAVVGYTDALAATLVTSEDGTGQEIGMNPADIEKQVSGFESELALLASI